MLQEFMAHVKDFQKGRWVCPSESMWRIYGFSLNEMYPSVEQLHVHMPDLHPVWFTAGRTLQDIISNPNSTKTQLTEFFAMNASDEQVRSMNLLSEEFPKHFVWTQQNRKWTARS